MTLLCFALTLVGFSPYRGISSCLSALSPALSLAQRHRHVLRRVYRKCELESRTKVHTCELLSSTISCIGEEGICMTDSIGERLKHLRKSRGLTLRQLAGLAHVPQSTLSSVETGARAGGKLSLETGKRLARALGISLDVIAGVY